MFNPKGGLEKMAYVIKDINTNQYYRQRRGSDGWYSFDINASRLYGKEKQAQKTIDDNDHHVSFPGNRNLIPVEVLLIEAINQHSVD